MTVNAVKDLNTFEPEWPEKTTAEYWKKLYRNTPYRSFLREYMNTHVEDGVVFRHEDILYGAMLPLDEYDSLVCYGDLSYKDAGDYKGARISYHTYFPGPCQSYPCSAMAVRFV